MTPGAAGATGRAYLESVARLRAELLAEYDLLAAALLRLAADIDSLTDELGREDEDDGADEDWAQH